MKLTKTHKIGIALAIGYLLLSMKKAAMKSPVKKFEIRDCDPHGCGGYAASRKRNGVSVAGGHNGIDIIAQPGEMVVAPISGKARTLYVYSGSTAMKGIEITNGNVKLKLFYVSTKNIVTGQMVVEGQFIGYAQDIAAYHNTPKMTPHIHAEVYVDGKNVDPSSLFQ